MKKTAICLISLLLVFGFILVQASSALEREVRIFAHTTGKARLSSHLHSVLSAPLLQHNDSFVTLSRDSENGITSIQIHATAMNQFAERLSMALHDAVIEYDSIRFGIPAGNLTNLVFLSGYGPLIPVKPIILGNIANQVKSDFISAGINQTLHRVTLTYAITIRYLAPLHDAYDSITLELTLAETLIVGDVPIYKD